MWLHLGHIRCRRMLEGFRCRYILGPAFSSVCFHVNDSNCYSRTYLISGKNVKWPDKLLALARHLLSRKTFCNLHLKSINLACANILYIHTHTHYIQSCENDTSHTKSIRKILSGYYQIGGHVLAECERFKASCIRYWRDWEKYTIAEWQIWMFIV